NSKRGAQTRRLKPRRRKATKAAYAASPRCPRRMGSVVGGGVGGAAAGRLGRFRCREFTRQAASCVATPEPRLLHRMRRSEHHLLVVSSLLRISNFGFRALRAALWLLLAILSVASPVWAHESRPAYLEIKEAAPGRFSLLWRTPVLSGMRLPVTLKMPD